VGLAVDGLGEGMDDGRDVGAADGAQVPTPPRATPQFREEQSDP